MNKNKKIKKKQRESSELKNFTSSKISSLKMVHSLINEKHLSNQIFYRRFYFRNF